MIRRVGGFGASTIIEIIRVIRRAEGDIELLGLVTAVGVLAIVWVVGAVDAIRSSRDSSRVEG